MKKTILLLTCLPTLLTAGNISFGIGCNMQSYRTRIGEQGLPFKEIDHKNLIAPSLFFAKRFKNPKFEFSFDIGYVRYLKTYSTNINWNYPILLDEVTTSVYERVPYFMPKLNYQLIKSKHFLFDVSCGFTYSIRLNGFTMTSNGKSTDSTISYNYSGDSNPYSKLNTLLGLQSTLVISKHWNIRLNVFNVFGGKKYFFKDQYLATDKAGNTRKLEYSLNGGFYCADIKLVYTY